MKQDKIFSQKFSTIIFLIVSTIAFVIVAIRSVTVPFTMDEALTFFTYIQSGKFLPFLSHADTNNHVLNSFLGWICFKFFGDSPFSLRLPNLFALVILIIAIKRISKYLTKTHSKLVLIAAFLLSFYWLNFYSVCRGYGLSMAFLLLAISYLMEYLNSKQLKKLFFFYLYIQIAISANLILVIISVPLTFFVLLFQFLNKKLFERINIIILLVYGVLIIFWLGFSFYLQIKFLHPNVGIFMGTSLGYWRITFVSLINMLLDTTNKWVSFLVLLCFFILVIVVVSINFKKIRINVQSIYSPSLFYTMILSTLIITVYVIHKLFNVSYPEDRMGLFFYLFFVLAVVFTLDEFSGSIVKFLSVFIFICSIIHFSVNLNFKRSVDLYNYLAFPEKFYTRINQEQQSNKEKITISGVEEISFSFMNYKHNGALNPPEVRVHNMDMGLDYVIAWKKKEENYKPYYEEIDYDKGQSLVLLKRKQKINRTLLLTKDSLTRFTGNDEFYDFYRVKDTVFKNRKPLLIEFNIKSIHAKSPVDVWLVFEIDTAGDNCVHYERIKLNYIRYNWDSAKDQKFCLQCPPLLPKVCTLKCYLWNIEKKELKFQMNYVKLFQLEGDGSNVEIPY